ncbi:LOW QUALITY PROTEIN: putative nucleic acid-binding protein [Rhizobium leguminosarum bv. trifolii WSM2012]|nr:LOW QUALITY PROTEIN: putative nucleic acid-binding protein [Rhizobium leguminosarum bv. trifolii WSM2012]
MSRLYMLDTNIVSELARNPKGIVARRIGGVGPNAIYVKIIMACELRYGCAKKGSAKLLAQIEAILLDSVPVLVLDAPADAEYGGIRAELEAAGKPIRANDMLMPPMHLPSGRLANG